MWKSTALHRVCRGELWLLCALSFNVLGVRAQDGPSVDPDPRAGASTELARVIVKFKADAPILLAHALSARASARETSDTTVARGDRLGARLGISLRAGRAISARAQVISAPGISGHALARRLAAEEDVEYAVVDERRKHFGVPNDPLYQHGPPIDAGSGGPEVGQWYLRAPGGEVAASINATGAWDLTIGSPDIVVAVLDTGIRPNHPDLLNRLVPGYDMVTDLPSANDGDGRDLDGTDPGDWVTIAESNDPASPFYQCGAEDSSWHGTKVASLVGAASHNQSGMAGVAWGIKLSPVRVLGKCGGYDSDIIAGMQWAAGLAVPGVPINPNPARVINLSLGTGGACPQSYIDAIDSISQKQNPAAIVVSAGNSAGVEVASPANCPGVISVAGVRHIGTKVGFSDVGPAISISAPAGNCVDPTPGSPCLYSIIAATDTGVTTPVASAYTDSFNYSVGTSFAAPLVAGTAALMLSVNPSLTPIQIKEALQRSARPFPTSGAAATVPVCHAPDGIEQLECYCTATTCGAGMLDAAAAVTAVAPAIQERNSLTQAWNLLGNGLNQSFPVATLFGDANLVSTVWKWDAVGGRWLFYTPQMEATALQTYATSKGYGVLAEIAPGEGYWVNANVAATLATRTGPGFALTDANLVTGWNLVATGQDITPATFNRSLSATPPAPGLVPQNLTTLWAWDNSSSRWYFYAPSLEANNGLAEYIASKGYLDFTQHGKTLGGGTGFWVNRP